MTSPQRPGTDAHGPSTPTVIAHRGFAGLAPENTPAAARLAAARGADVIECDVVATADGDPVVFHDPALDASGESRGITDRTGRVAERTTDYVTGATVLGSGEHVPTFARFVEAVPASVSLNVELKRPRDVEPRHGVPPDEIRVAHREAWQPLVDRVLDVLDTNARGTWFSSFSQSALEAVRRRETSARIAPLAESVETALEMAEMLGTDTIHPPITSLTTVEASRRLDAYTVNAWTARTWTDARDALRHDVDGLIADYPDLDAITDGSGTHTDT
ncbi:glycerophosphoryl diester phosphodiesterase [Halarchaeum rubridurum]|uniref:Glycerophosphoryl diester phosphodiesterase n=1 Tax=Halarchaeum rubridurum TaxID=489911 RepID=A0A830FYY9_9EURY|nr:glycerophosphodiester phosphodiesterase [Halarchaeum rubridurum]MBP1954669.1 glycerophosphoryl diester phosphodiesterase [Halarchaeum rubridurum]GGM62905.1 glycerophosphoryl diester phosphodiesterase [Halarchaeum rubridurum]